METAETTKPLIDFSEFLEIEKKLDIRYGTITAVEKMEKSNKMLKLEVDFGTETRTVLTNIGNRIDRPEYLVGYQFPFVMNLKPTKIMGVESSAMIMVVEGSEGKIVFPHSGNNFLNGSRLI